MGLMNAEQPFSISARSIYRRRK